MAQDKKKIYLKATNSLLRWLIVKGATTMLAKKKLIFFIDWKDAILNFHIINKINIIFWN